MSQKASQPTQSQALGQQGENQALVFLLQNGLTLVERNFRCRGGEIDLVMQQRETVVFVEVRKRRNAHFGGAAASVTAAKQGRLILAAKVFMQRYAAWPPCRFDVIAIEAGKIEWLKNAIEA